MHSFGDSERTIAEALRIPKTTVHRTIQRGTVEDREGRGRKKTARTPENVEQAREMIQEDPTTSANSTRKLGKKLIVDSIIRIFRSDPFILLHPV